MTWVQIPAPALDFSVELSFGGHWLTESFFQRLVLNGDTLACKGIFQGRRLEDGIPHAIEHDVKC